jgi:hypothetical protein
MLKLKKLVESLTWEVMAGWPTRDETIQAISKMLTSNRHLEHNLVGAIEEIDEPTVVFSGTDAELAIKKQIEELVLQLQGQLL